jgi:hypothetical protein
MKCEITDIITWPRTKRNLILLSYPKGTSRTTKKALRKIDPLTCLFCLVQPPKIIAENTEAPHTSVDVETAMVDLGWRSIGDGFDEWEKVRVKVSYKKVSPSFSTMITLEGDFIDGVSCMDSILNNGLKSSLIFPMKDTDDHVSIDVALQVFKDIDLTEGLGLPKSYNNGFDMLSDESFSRIFFYSLGAPLVAVQERDDPAVVHELGPFVVDMPLQDLKYRSLYRPLGARIHFGENQMPTAIYDYDKKELLKPGDDGWDAAKFLAKSTALTLVTVREHLIWCHLVLSNTITATTTLELAPSHPIRRLMAIFTYNSVLINQLAFDSLAAKTGPMHRGTGFEYESLQEVFEMSYKQCNMYQPFTEHELAPELASLAEEGKFPYITEGREYWKIVHTFVTAWIHEAGDAAEDEQAMAFYDSVQKSTRGQAYELPDYNSTEDMIKLITQSIFTVTAHHELVGAVVDYSMQPDRAGFRIAKDCDGNETDLQSFLLQGIIAATTSVKMPSLMKPFTNFFGVGGAPSWERDLWITFQDKLKEQSELVDKRDATRDVEFKYFNPKLFECSVSV